MVWPSRAVIIAAMYLSMVLSMAEMSSALPTAGGATPLPGSAGPVGWIRHWDGDSH
ncbi:ethanolamine permease domain protein [Mycobacteroides abscessus]|nr:ethanolamine permease domain protein [Mycobacteroides abscessus]